MRPRKLKPRRLTPMAPVDFRRHAAAVMLGAGRIAPHHTRDYYVMASGAIYWRRGEFTPSTAHHAGCFTAESEHAHVLDCLCEAHAEALAAHLATRAAA
jgi:hypothetical protein